jgi:hypothetical protein
MFVIKKSFFMAKLLLGGLSRLQLYNAILAFIYATDSRASSERYVIDGRIKGNAFQTNSERIEIE